MPLETPPPTGQRRARPWALLGAALLTCGLAAALKADAPPTPAPKPPPKQASPAPPAAGERPAKRPNPAVQNAREMLRRNQEMQQRMIRRLAEWQERMENLPGVQGLPGLPGGAAPDFGPRPGGQREEARLGVRVEKPSPTLAQQLDLPRDQGLVVEEVLGDSAAAAAGVQPHDILLELGGKPVPGDLEEFGRLMQGFRPGERLDAVVLRKARKETLKGLTLRGAAVGDLPLVLPEGAYDPQRGFTTVTREAGSFTVRHQKGVLAVTVTGRLAGGKAELREVKVRDGGKAETYAGVGAVPAAHRDKVKELLQLAEKGKGRFQLHLP